MVGAVVLSPTDAASQEPVVDSAQRVVVARARAPCDAVDVLKQKKCQRREEKTDKF